MSKVKKRISKGTKIAKKRRRSCTGVGFLPFKRYLLHGTRCMRMRANSVLRVLLVLVLSVIFTLLPFTLAHARRGCLSKGITSTGSDATTIRGCGYCGCSEASATIATHSAYAEYSGEGYFAGFCLNANDTGQGMFAGTGIGKEGNSLELVLTVADISKFSDFLISAKYQFLGEASSRPAMAVGIDAVSEIPEQMHSSFYIVASKCVRTVKLPLLASLGWGSGRFEDNFFGSLAFVLSRRWSFIVEYDGLGGNVGMSFATEVSLWKPLPLVVILGVHNAFASEEESTFGLGVGVRFP